MLPPHPPKKMIESRTTSRNIISNEQKKSQDGKQYPTFTVTIGNKKETGEMEYHLKAPHLEYHQNASNICCFSSLASAFIASG